MSSLTIVRTIKARPAVVFEALSTSEGLRHWIGPDAGPVLVAEVDVRVGGKYRLRFRMLDGSEHEVSGEYVEVTPPWRLVMTWLWRGDETATRVEMTLRETPEGTELTFTHSGLADQRSADGHTRGWNGSLDKLLAALEAGSPERRVRSGDAELQVQGFGDPRFPCQLLVMGSQASMLWWPAAFCERLAARGRHVLRFDARDTGRSTKWPPGSPGYSLDDMAADLVAILDAYGVERAHVAGVSMGGVMGQIAALENPRRVASLALISSTPIAAERSELPPPTEAFTEVARRGRDIDWNDRDQAIGFMLELQRVLVGPELDEAAARGLIEEDFDRSGGLASSTNHFQLDGGATWAGRLGELQAPLVVIHGTRDPLFPLEHGRALARSVAGARLVELDGRHGLHEAGWQPIIEQLMTMDADPRP